MTTDSSTRPTEESIHPRLKYLMAEYSMPKYLLTPLEYAVMKYLVDSRRMECVGIEYSVGRYLVSKYFKREWMDSSVGRFPHVEYSVVIYFESNQTRIDHIPRAFLYHWLTTTPIPSQDSPSDQAHDKISRLPPRLESSLCCVCFAGTPYIMDSDAKAAIVRILRQFAKGHLPVERRTWCSICQLAMTTTRKAKRGVSATKNIWGFVGSTHGMCSRCRWDAFKRREAVFICYDDGCGRVAWSGPDDDGKVLCPKCRHDSRNRM
jgi:hypothetical protein